MIKLKINGEERELDVDPDTPLLWVIRDELKLTGTKFGCGVAQCGACTVHLDGSPVRACQTPISDVEDSEIRTIEYVVGSSASKEGKAVQAAWRALDVVQCGYCQSGQMMSAVALLTTNKKPSDKDIDTAMNGNVCRCATYQRIRAAIHDAAKRLEA
ncbi:(2Fe-2S)-binding protein [Chelatococcus sambhunathii]|uniref:(2Fe-2S)-binding protein n=1 Tax=Chelatococcus sambhunathii TaxID=363953 RepID=A0ABU1DDW9_9HYPH|nr:2Fe-2S iron-sulfur cluster-binding protein [Chelatococcus sambhunathii]MDR4306238.1 (2Fe-2S)-binding protein [Chelatococcus sambhunathii]